MEGESPNKMEHFSFWIILSVSSASKDGPGMMDTEPLPMQDHTRESVNGTRMDHQLPNDCPACV